MVTAANHTDLMQPNVGGTRVAASAERPHGRGCNGTRGTSARSSHDFDLASTAARRCCRTRRPRQGRQQRIPARALESRCRSVLDSQRDVLVPRTSRCLACATGSQRRGRQPVPVEPSAAPLPAPVSRHRGRGPSHRGALVADGGRRRRQPVLVPVRAPAADVVSVTDLYRTRLRLLHVRRSAACFERRTFSIDGDAGPGRLASRIAGPPCVSIGVEPLGAV